MRLFQRHWYAILSVIMRIPVAIKSWKQFFSMFWIHRFHRNFYRRRTERFPRRRKIWSDHTNYMIFICIICSVLAMPRQRFTVWRKLLLRELMKWLKTFYRRFFAQQFKRSCLPDGPKVGSVAVSPRGDLRMPSDASARIWMEELEALNTERR